MSSIINPDIAAPAPEVVPVAAVPALTEDEALAYVLEQSELILAILKKRAEIFSYRKAYIIFKALATDPANSAIWRFISVRCDISILQAFMREKFPENTDRAQYPLVAALLEFRVQAPTGAAASAPQPARAGAGAGADSDTAAAPVPATGPETAAPQAASTSGAAASALPCASPLAASCAPTDLSDSLAHSSVDTVAPLLPFEFAAGVPLVLPGGNLPSLIINAALASENWPPDDSFPMAYPTVAAAFPATDSVAWQTNTIATTAVAVGPFAVELDRRAQTTGPPLSGSVTKFTGACNPPPSFGPLEFAYSWSSVAAPTRNRPP